MTELKTLSEKRKRVYNYRSPKNKPLEEKMVFVYPEENVKEFIKKVLTEIREEIDAVPHIRNINAVHKLHIVSRLENIKRFIDKLAGKKLI
jgi:hypothetical protein